MSQQIPEETKTERSCRRVLATGLATWLLLTAAGGAQEGPESSPYQRAGSLWTNRLDSSSAFMSDRGRTFPSRDEGLSGRDSSVEPWKSKSLSPRASHKLATAFPVAVRRLREEPACRGLFQELGAEGLEALAKSLYYESSLAQEQGPCRRGTAFTAVGSRVTRLCRSFGRLPDNRAAIALIHEALHLAGMTERPMDPDALDSSAINHLVATACVL